MTPFFDPRQTGRHRNREAGFTLMETLVAMGVLTFGLLALAQTFVIGMTHMSFSTASIVAREKAREAIESVHTARDTRTITWAQIRNVAAGGVFLDAETALLRDEPNDDGLINTADDGPSVESLTLPGEDNELGTGDDVLSPLNGYFRRIMISDIAGSTTLRQLRVIMRYPVGSQPAPATCIRGDGTPLTQPGCYVLTTFISQYS
jgi:type II secretory pathway pseudopilin PulG